MEKPIKGIRGRYFNDITDDYRRWSEKSFLYRTFWSESIVKLLKKHVKKLPKEVEELLEKRFLWLQEEEASWQEYDAKIRRVLAENMRKHPEWKHKVLIKPPQRTKNQKKERRDFWEELMLNDASYEAGLITDTEYYLWLIEYLAARDIYYKDSSIDDGHMWLYELLLKGLGRELEESARLDEVRKLEKEIEKLEKEIEKLEKEIMEMKDPKEHEGQDPSKNLKKLERARGRKESRKQEKIKELEKIRELEKLKKPKKPEMLRAGSENIRDKAGVGRDLTELAEKVRHERKTGSMEISSRLHDLKHKGETRAEDYLPWLTRQLGAMAVHIKIKTWLQDNGYPIADDDRAKKHDEDKERLQECRKQDFSMRLFEAFCDSEKGYEFSRKEDSVETDEDWVVKNGFCVWKPDDFKHHIQKLLQALKQGHQEALRQKNKDGGQDFYFPLAMDLQSGCVFFLAGKRYYDKVYEKSKNVKLQEEYKKQDAFFCYDYLRLDKRADSEDPEVAFRLQPTFHENAGKSYDEVLSDFKWYCESGSVRKRVSLVVGGGGKHYYEDVDDIPRQKIKAYNEDGPVGIPGVFQRFFEDSED